MSTGFDLSWVYRIVDKYTAPIKKIQRATAGVTRTINTASKSVKKLGDRFGNLKTMIGAAAGIAMIAFPVKKAIDFESAMIDVKKVMNFKSKDSFHKFREGIFKTAISLGKLPVNIAKIAFEGGKIGILEKNMGGFIALVARTSVAFDMSEQSAGNALGSIKAKLGITVPAVGAVMDAINKLADNTATSGERVLNVVMRTVGTMKSIKMPPQLIAGWSAFADQLEVSPELAASGLSMMINKMILIPGMMRKLLKDPNKAIKGFLQKFSKMSEIKRAGKILKVFGRNAGKFVLKAVNSLELLDRTMSFVTKKSSFMGSMQLELQKKLKGTATAIGRIKAVSDFVMIAIGDSLIPIIKDITPAIIKVISAIREFVSLHPGIVKLGAAFIGLSIILSGVGLLITGIGITFNVLFAPITAGVLALAALAGLVIYYWKPIKSFFIFLGNSLIGAWDGFVKFVSSTASLIFDPIMSGFNKLMNVFGEFGKLFKRGAKLFGPLVPQGMLDFISEFDRSFLKGGKSTIKIETIDKTKIKLPVIAVLKSKIKIPTIVRSIPKTIVDTSLIAKNYLKQNNTTVNKNIVNGSISANNLIVKSQIAGVIEVRAKRGSEVVRAEIDHSSPGNTGLNMAY